MDNADLDGVLAVFEAAMAAPDPELERVIAEINLVYEVEMGETSTGHQDSLSSRDALGGK